MSNVRLPKKKLMQRTVWKAADEAAVTAYDFAAWLADVGELHDLTAFHLLALYNEFAMYVGAVPLSDGKLFRQLRAAGITRYRKGTGTRQWVYRLQQSR